MSLARSQSGSLAHVSSVLLLAALLQACGGGGGGNDGTAGMAPEFVLAQIPRTSPWRRNRATARLGAR